MKYACLSLILFSMVFIAITAVRFPIAVATQQGIVVNKFQLPGWESKYITVQVGNILYHDILVNDETYFTVHKNTQVILLISNNGEVEVQSVIEY